MADCPKCGSYIINDGFSKECACDENTETFYPGDGFVEGKVCECGGPVRLISSKSALCKCEHCGTLTDINDLKTKWDDDEYY